MKAKLLRDIYRYENGVLRVFAEKGAVLEIGPLSEKVDWLVGCKTAELVKPLDGGRVRLLGEGYDFECVD
jgi:hypothetical protein